MRRLDARASGKDSIGKLTLNRSGKTVVARNLYRRAKCPTAENLLFDITVEDIVGLIGDVCYGRIL